MTTTAAVPKARTPRRTRVAEIAGILGAIVCILALVAVWLGAAAVSGKVDDLSNAVNAGVQKAVDVTNTVAGRLDGLASQVGGVAQNANDVAANPTPPDALAGLSERYAQFIATYQNIRVQYSDAKANLKFPAGARSVYSYTVKVPNGTFTFPDTAADSRKELSQLELFVVQAAADPCGISA